MSCLACDTQLLTPDFVSFESISNVFLACFETPKIKLFLQNGPNLEKLSWFTQGFRPKSVQNKFFLINKL